MSKSQRWSPFRWKRSFGLVGRVGLLSALAVPTACGTATSPVASSAPSGAPSSEADFESLFEQATFASGTTSTAGDLAGSNRTGAITITATSEDIPVKISVRPSDGALLVNGRVAQVGQRRYSGADTDVYVKSEPLTLKPTVLLDLSLQRGPKSVTFKGDAASKLIVKGSNLTDRFAVQKDGSLAVNGSIVKWFTATNDDDWKDSTKDPFTADSMDSVTLLMGGGSDTYDGSLFTKMWPPTVSVKTLTGTEKQYQYRTFSVKDVKIFGGAGRDTFFSGAYRETFIGGAGTDVVKSLGFKRSGVLHVSSAAKYDDVAAATAAEAKLFDIDSGATAGAHDVWKFDSITETADNTDTEYKEWMDALFPTDGAYDTLSADVLDLADWLTVSTQVKAAATVDASILLKNPETIGGIRIVNIEADTPTAFPDDLTKLVDGYVQLTVKRAGRPTKFATMFGLAKLVNTPTDTKCRDITDSTAAPADCRLTSGAKVDDVFTTFRAPAAPIEWFGSTLSERFVQSATALPDYLSGGGGVGSDTVSYELRSKPVLVDFNEYKYADAVVGWDHPKAVDEAVYHGEASARSFNVYEGDVLRGFENAVGGAGSDLLKGSEGPNRLEGGPGDDYIFGGPGSDILAGGDGIDRLDGGEGATDVNIISYWDALTGVVVDLTRNLGAVAAGGEFTIAGHDTSSKPVLKEADGTINCSKDNSDPDKSPLPDLKGYTYSKATGRCVAMTVGTNDYIWNINGVEGSPFDDILTAAIGGSTMMGGEGNNTFNLADGTDSKDSVWGGSGIDWFIKVDGTDAVLAGAGDDFFEGTALPTGTVDDAARKVASAAADANGWKPLGYPAGFKNASNSNQADDLVLKAALLPPLPETIDTPYVAACGEGSDVVSWSTKSGSKSSTNKDDELVAASCNDDF